MKKRIKIKKGEYWAKMLVRITGKSIEIMPAINPDGSPSTPLPGFKWMDAICSDYGTGQK